MPEKTKYIVAAGFLHGRIDEVTGEGLISYHRGDVIALTDDEAAVELHRNRIVPFDEGVLEAMQPAPSEEAAT